MENSRKRGSCLFRSPHDEALGAEQVNTLNPSAFTVPERLYVVKPVVALFRHLHFNKAHTHAKTVIIQTFHFVLAFCGGEQPLPGASYPWEDLLTKLGGITATVIFYSASCDKCSATPAQVGPALSEDGQPKFMDNSKSHRNHTPVLIFLLIQNSVDPRFFRLCFLD